MPHRPRRVARTFQYFCYSAAGFLAAIQPSLILRNNAASAAIYGWVVLLGLGAALCLVGALRNSWTWEYVGLGPMVFAMGGYSLLAVITVASGHLTALIPAFFYMAITSGLIARWREVSRERRITKAFSELYH